MKRKIHVVKQSSNKDCGPASLLSIILYYGGHVNLEKIKVDAKTTNLGTSAYDLIKAANKYGFDACGYNLEIEDLYKEGRRLPIICHMTHKRLNHFVVLYNINSKNVTLMDPAYGKRVVPVKEFVREWTGKILEFCPRSNIVTMNKNNKLNLIFLEVVKKECKLIRKIILISLCFTVSSLICTYYLKVIMEKLNYDYSYIIFVTAFFAIMTIFKVILYNQRVYYIENLNKNLDATLYSEFFMHLFNLPSKVYDSKTMGEIITRIQDLNNFKMLFSDILVSFFLDFILTLLAVPLLLYISRSLFIILLLLIILYLITGIIFSKLLYKKVIENKEFETDFNNKLYENILMFKNIKNLNKVNTALNTIERSCTNLIYNSYNISLINNFQYNLKNFFSEAGYFLVNAFGIYLIYNEKLSLIDLVTYNTIMTFFLDPIKNLINNIPKYSFVRASIFKLNDFMDIDQEENKEATDLNSFKITFENVDFGYSDFNIVLNKKSFVINEKEHVFLSGSSGSGKSTICKLLIKEEELNSGKIMVGNSNIKNLSLNTIRNNIMYLSQKEYLFSDTILNNILFFREVSDDTFEEVLKICNVNKVLESKFLGLESMIEMDANNLSGGEKQRLILARACLNPFKILIIDEALSEVDKKTEIEIIKGLKKYFKDRTIIYISHKNLEKEFKKVLAFE